MSERRLRIVPSAMKVTFVLGAVVFVACSSPTSPTSPNTTEDPPPAAGIPVGVSRQDLNADYPVSGVLQYRILLSNYEEKLNLTKSKGIKVIVHMVSGNKDRYQNADGSFNVEMWKDELRPWQGLIEPWIADGTIIGHYVLDEPHAGGQWDGTEVPVAPVNEAACFSKSFWPELQTNVRSPPSYFLAQGYDPSDPGSCIDIATSQWHARKGDVEAWAEEQIADLQQIDMGLYFNVNALDGGDGSSGIASDFDPDRWVMSADELLRYGRLFLSYGETCGLGAWRWRGAEGYWEQDDIRAAWQELVDLAATHQATPCAR